MYIDRKKYYRISPQLYGGLINLLLTLPLSMKKMTAVEIGSYIGESANILSLFFSDVICIDPMLDPSVQQIFESNTRGRNIGLIPKTSRDAHVDLYSGSYGLVYIDGIHTHPEVKADISNYYPKVAPECYIGGHDYGPGPENAGVVQAVNEAFGEPDFTFSDESWLVKKTPGRMK
jgi:hypothetical protein